MPTERLYFDLPVGTESRLKQLALASDQTINELAGEGLDVYLRFLEWITTIKADAEAVRRGEIKTQTLEEFAKSMGFDVAEILSRAAQVEWDEELPFGIKTGEAFITYLIEGPVLDGRANGVD